MTVIQKLIKAFALLLAAVIIVSIGAAIVGGVSLLAGITTGEGIFPWSQGAGSWTSESWTEREVTALDLNVRATAVKILVDDAAESVMVETNNEYVTTWRDGQTLNVVEKSHGLFGWGNVGEVVIRVREGMNLERVRLEIGAGTLEIEELTVKNLALELGAGRTTIDNLVVKETAKIDGGAGKLEIRDGNLRNVELEMGAGKAEVRAKFGGRSKIESGVGRLELELIGRADEYSLKIDKGIGTVMLDGREVADGATWGEGNNTVEVRAGVGAVEIRTEE